MLLYAQNILMKFRFFIYLYTNVNNFEICVNKTFMNSLVLRLPVDYVIITVFSHSEGFVLFFFKAFVYLCFSLLYICFPF